MTGSTSLPAAPPADVSSGALGHAKIILTGVGAKPEEIELGDETIIGRSVHADIQLDGDLVSRRHARIFQREGRAGRPAW